MGSLAYQPFYEACTIKRQRRTKAEMAALRDAIYRALARSNPMTDRQVFYQLVSHCGLRKLEKEYQNAVVRVLTLMRREGRIHYGWITDSTRLMRKPPAYSSPLAALRETVRAYRRAIWEEQDVVVIEDYTRSVA